MRAYPSSPGNPMSLTRTSNGARPSADRAPPGPLSMRHTGVLRGFLVLDEGEATLGLDRPEAEHAVRTGARQDHADRAPFQRLRERAEEVVDRRMAVGRDTRRDREDAVTHRQVRIRRNHIQAIPLHMQAVGDGDNGHRGRPGQDLGQPALVLGVEVLDEHETHPGVDGSAFRSWLKASKPPAEAPMPTIGHVVSEGSEMLSASGAAGMTARGDLSGACLRAGRFRAVLRLIGGSY